MTGQPLCEDCPDHEACMGGYPCEVVKEADRVMRQNDDGTWSPAKPIGWLEEHNRWERLIFWLRRIEHCNDQEGRRRQRKGKRR